MSLNHLTDQEIQNYLDLGDKQLNSGQLKHLRDCRECNKKLENYQFLLSQVQIMDHFEPGIDFTDRIMDSIMVHQEKRTFFDWIIQISIYLSLSFAVLFLLYLLFLNQQIVFNVIQGILSFFDSLFPKNSFLLRNTKTLLILLCSLIAFFAFDNSFIRHKFFTLNKKLPLMIF